MFAHFTETLALLVEYFDGNSLALLTKQELGMRLDRIAYGQDFDEVAFKVIGWTERQSRTKDLIKGMYMQRPDCEDIKSLARKVGIQVDNESP